MIQENLDYLKQQVKRAGFGEALENELKEKMGSVEPAFQLKYPQQVGKDEVEATLNFRKSAQNDNYYFNSYEVAVREENSKDPAVKQTFYVGKDNNYSLDEAYNLLSHRFVNKDLVNATGESYNAWVKLDFKETDTHGNFKTRQFNEKWGFDLDKALDKYPMIKELSNETDKAALVDSLKKGNRAEVTLEHDGAEKKGFVVANAYTRLVNVTDENNEKIRLTKKEDQGQSNNQGADNKQRNNAAEDNKNTQKNNRRRGQGVSGH